MGGLSAGICRLVFVDGYLLCMIEAVPKTLLDPDSEAYRIIARSVNSAEAFCVSPAGIPPNMSLLHIEYYIYVDDSV